MKQKIIFDEENTGFYRTYHTGDFEFVNPVEHYASIFIEQNMTMERDWLQITDFPFMSDEHLNSVLYKRAFEKWNQQYEEIISTAIPENFIFILTTDKKKEQIKLLKGQGLTINQLLAFIFKAWKEYGFTLSQYIGEQHHKGLDESELPQLVQVNNDKIRKIGETELTDGQLKHAVEYRKVVVAKVLDKGDDWHCFYVTYKSLNGQESWKDGQAHFHYISNKFGITRKDLVDRLKSEKYPTSPVHIDMLNYGNQSNKK